MSDPLPIIVTTAAATAVATKFTELAWSSGERWIRSYFKDHKPAAIKAAERNSREMLDRLAGKIARMETEAEVTQSIFERALNEPSFGSALQKALIGSSQTDSKEKHEILAQLLANRLGCEADSLLGVCTGLACDAVAHLTVDQVKILGLLATFLDVKPDFMVRKIPFSSREAFLAACEYFVESRFGGFTGLQVKNVDIRHLEALSCISNRSAVNASVIWLTRRITQSGFELERDDMLSWKTGREMVQIWESMLKQLRLTSIGSLIGILTSDLLSGRTTDLTYFNQS